ncbi:MAG: M14 family zinc carboxypeptidase, partial [Bacteriovoracaceae bacterium]
IHAGEIDGKDATFWLLKDALENKIKPDPLKGICLVFIPIMNLDGHERFGKYNRPNQVGPEEMGWRVTAQNYNLNRDYMKSDSPEMRMINKFWRQVNPVISLDLHVTDGAEFQPEVGLIILPNTSFGTTDFHKAGSAFETALLEKMKARGHSALPFYPSFEKEDDPMSGFSRYVAQPRFSQSYWYNNNRIGMLVETHSWKDYATRVKTHYSTVLSTLQIAQQEGKNWQKIEKALDKESLVGKKYALEYKHTDKSQEIAFPGYEYKKIKSDVSGADVIVYDISKKQNWNVPYYEELVPSLEVVVPAKGYFIGPAEVSIVQPILDAHAIKYRKWKGEDPIGFQVFRATKTEFSNKPFEGHQTLKVTGEWKEEKVKLLPGTLFVPIEQKAAKLVLQLLEPQPSDSLVSWGFFNRYFEQKEYMESYVTHQVGLKMLHDEKIRKEFEEKLENKEFFRNPEERNNFFYKKHPSWDDRFNRYPVFRI